MRQMIEFEKNIKDDVLTVLESSEVEPGVVKQLHQEKYSFKEVKKASNEGIQPFTQLIRRQSFFPCSDLCTKLFEDSVEFFKNKSEEKIIIEYDDVEAFPQEEEEDFQ